MTKGTSYTVTAEMIAMLNKIVDRFEGHTIRRDYGIDGNTVVSIQNVLAKRPSKSDLEITFGLLQKLGLVVADKREFIR